MAVVNELVTKFTFQGNLKPLTNFQDGLRNSILNLGKLGLALGATATAVTAWANSTLRGTESLIRLSDETGIAIQSLQELQFITAQSGLASNDFENSIISLTDKIGEAATQGSEDFNRLGISVRDANGIIKGTDVILNELVGTFSTLDRSQQINFASKLGIDIKLIKALSRSDDELKKLSERALKFGLITDAQTRKLDQYFASIETLKFGFSAISRQMALNFAPVLEKTSNIITDFLADFGKDFSFIFAEFVDGIGNLIGAVNNLVQATIGWKPILLAFGAAMLVAFPVVRIVSLIGGILIAIEDLITAFKGGKSVIADFFKDTFDFDIVEAMTKALGMLNMMLDDLKAKFKSIIDFFKDGLTSFNIDALVPPLLRTSATPITQSVDNRSTTPTMSNNIRIEVKGSDPVTTGEAVSTALTRELENASFQFSNKGGR